jgi:hypothetical protein
VGTRQLDPEVHNALVHAALNGGGLRPLARAAGIGKTTLSRMLAEGRSELAAGHTTDPLARLAAGVERSRAIFAVERAIREVAGVAP